MDRRAVLWMELDEWKTAACEGKAPDTSYALQKSVVGEFKQVEGIERAIEFVISRDSVDRDNDTIKQSGWDLTNFLKNPVVPFAHDYHSLPVARAVQTHIVGDRTLSTSQFATREMYPFADTVYQMVKGGFLNAVSVGFRPKNHEVNKDRGGIDFLAQELLEYSVVPIPSNPQALVQARSLGIDMKPLKEWAEQILDEDKDTSIWMPRKQLEQAHSALSPITIIIGGKTVFDTVEQKEQVETTATGKTVMESHDYETDEEIVKAGRHEEAEVSQSQTDETVTKQATSSSDGTGPSSDEVKSPSSTVQKINPIVLNNPLPNSREWVKHELEEQIPNFLTRNGNEFRADMDMPVVFATFEGRALFCVIGRDRPFSDDPTYQGSFDMSQEAGMPQWLGTPTPIEIEVSFDVVQQAQNTEQLSAVASWKESGKEGEGKGISAPVVQVPVMAKQSTNRFPFSAEMLKQSLVSLVPDIVREEVRNTVTRTVRQLQGRVD